MHFRAGLLILTRGSSFPLWYCSILGLEYRVSSAGVARFSVGFSFSWLAKKGKRSEWLLGKKIRGKVWKASKLSNTDLKENTAAAQSGFPRIVLTSLSQILQLI